MPEDVNSLCKMCRVPSCISSTVVEASIYDVANKILQFKKYISLTYLGHLSLSLIMNYNRHGVALVCAWTQSVTLQVNE